MSTVALVAPAGVIVGACVAAMAALWSARHTARTNKQIAEEERQYKVVDGLLEAANKIEASFSDSRFNATPYREFRLAYHRLVATRPSRVLLSAADALARDMQALGEVIQRLETMEADLAEQWRLACSEPAVVDGNYVLQQTEVTWSYQAAVGSRRADQEGSLGEQVHAQEELERTIEACGEVDWRIVDELIRCQDEIVRFKSKRERIKEHLEAAYGKLSAAVYKADGDRQLR